MTGNEKMKVKIYRLKNMLEADKKRILQRCQVKLDEIIEQVRPIIDGVKDRGDDALIEYTFKLDKVKLEKKNIEVKKRDIDAAYKKIDKILPVGKQIGIRRTP